MYVFTMYPNTYSDFVDVSNAFGDTSNTWVAGRLLELYWLFAFFAWIIVCNLDLTLRPSTSVQPISEFAKEGQRTRRLHEASVLLLSFWALFFLVGRQNNNTLSPSLLSGLHPCSGEQGKRFWRCIQTRLIVVGDKSNNLGARNKTDDLSSASRPLLADHKKDMYLTAATSPSIHGDRLNHSGDKPYSVDYSVESRGHCPT
jgi:hypothetical protein